ncbi:restriction endonuclease [Photobacterium sanguinicancri]|uniref:Restriction endonuclease n=1 Tax=Photobacterium sanguinicancri TaxID=875932 RepID=A0ABX4FT47_9GAMM|nr:restriction endonuclease [Photobacterium sanguinicancri]OZS42039.1 restriction endonuclease [Photobacterium sanguinicancri]
MSGREQYETGKVSTTYEQKSIKKRIEAFLIDNVGKIVTREMIIQVSKDPKTGKEPENWHQRLSELRTDDGYTILSKRDRAFLSVEEYVLESLEKRKTAGKRVLPTKATWSTILERANNCCEWRDGGEICGLSNGSIDPIGGGTVKLTPDHMQPHSINPNADPESPEQWQALCGRHQVIKKNFWDSSSGKMNTIAILQALPHKEKEAALMFLLKYFGKDLA